MNLQNARLGRGSGILLVVATSLANLFAAEDSPLKAEIIVGTNTYELGRFTSGKAFAARLRAAESGGLLPACAPTVDLTLWLTNAGKKPIRIIVGGDRSRLDLDLSGPGAVNLHPQPPLQKGMFELAKGRIIALAVGESHDLPITSLSSGLRGLTKSSFWTEPGEYTLTATYTCPMAVVPEDKPLPPEALPALTELLGKQGALTKAKPPPVKLKVVEAATARSPAN
jgi:hypothetical protein